MRTPPRLPFRTLRPPLLAVAVAAGAVLAGAGPASGAAEAGPPRVATELPATATATDGPVANNSPALAVDPSDSRVVALANRIDALEFSCALQVSGDGGRTFVSAYPVPELPEGAERCYAPEVAFDGDGTLYYLFVGLVGAGNEPMGVFLTTSTDRGASFSAPRQVLGGNNFGVRMAIDPATNPRGRLHLVWLAAGGDPGVGSLPSPPNPIMASYSDDGGTTFSPPVQVSDGDRQHVVAPALALGPDRAVHVAYYDLGDDRRDYHGLAGPTWERPWTIVVASSPDGGRSFGPGVVVDDTIVPTGRVMLIFTMPPPALVAGDDDALFVAWPDARHGDADVLLRRSGDGGRSWAPATRVNDDPEANGRTQDLPRLAVTPGGRVDAIFYDRRHDPEDVRNHLRYTYSTDGGRTFAANLEVTDKPSDSRVGPQYLGPAAEGLVEFGSRLALVSSDEAALAAWTDTRNSMHPRQQDIFATTLQFPSAGPSTRPWLPLGGVAVALAAGAAVLLARRRDRAAHPEVTR